MFNSVGFGVLGLYVLAGLCWCVMFRCGILGLFVGVVGIAICVFLPLAGVCLC